MQLKLRKNKGKLTAAILMTGCFMLTTAHSAMAQQDAAVPPVQIDLSKIKPAADMKKALSDGMAGMPEMMSGMMSGMPGMPAKTAAADKKSASAASAATGSMKQKTASGTESFMDSNTMLEMQQKAMMENMKKMQPAIQASVMKNVLSSMNGMQSAPQGTGADAKSK